jgi:hypothetical protein
LVTHVYLNDRPNRHLFARGQYNLRFSADEPGKLIIACQAGWDPEVQLPESGVHKIDLPVSFGQDHKPRFEIRTDDGASRPLRSPVVITWVWGSHASLDGTVGQIP